MNSGTYTSYGQLCISCLPTPQLRRRHHPHATTRTRTVENAIDRFCNIQGLNIRRKVSRNDQSGKSSWWFVIHAEESVLNDLESKWDSLNTQTSWLLKSCSKSRDVEDSGSTLSPSVSESNTGNPTTTQLLLSLQMMPTLTAHQPLQIDHPLPVI